MLRKHPSADRVGQVSTHTLLVVLREFEVIGGDDHVRHNFRFSPRHEAPLSRANTMPVLLKKADHWLHCPAHITLSPGECNVVHVE
jgi:hypothetical protein